MRAHIVGEFEVQQHNGLQIFRLFCRIRNRTVSLQKWLLLHVLRWYFNCIYFGGGQLAFRHFFFFVKNTSIHGQKVLNPFFFWFVILSFRLAAIYTFFSYSVHTISHVWKKLRIPAPYISDQFYYYRSDLPTFLSTFSKISQNFRHYPVFFYMHTITCSFQAEEQWKKHLFFLHFSLVWTEGRQ